MKNFDCQSMPEDVKNYFFDSYRLPNNSVIKLFVSGENELIRNWLVNSGANIDDEITIKYHWINTKTELFSYKDFITEED